MIATAPIARHEVVAVHGGIIVPSEDISEYRRMVGGIRGVQVDDGYFLCPTEKEGGRFNHSCCPNIGFRGSIVVVAMRDIVAGEELVIDYGLSESGIDAFKCRCGARACRKIITKTDWLTVCSDSTTSEYCSPYLRRKRSPPTTSPGRGFADIQPGGRLCANNR